MLVYGAGAAFFSLEPEPTQSGRSRSRLQDLGLLEPEPQKKWRLRNTENKQKDVPSPRISKLKLIKERLFLSINQSEANFSQSS